MTDSSDCRLVDFLASGNIICPLLTTNSNEAIRELSLRLAENTAGLSPDAVVDAIMERERLTPTLIAPGLAAPHARLPNLTAPLVALGTSMEGVDFGVKGAVAHVVILFVTPKDDPGLHLKLLSALAKDFSKPGTPKRLAAFENPKDIIGFLKECGTPLPAFLKARDVMDADPVVLLESDPLGKAIEAFATKNVLDIPVIDSEGDLRGVVSVEDVLRLSLPEHLLWMNDLTPIVNFQPFAEMLRDDHETKLADFMREEFISAPEDIPAIQLAKTFLIDKARQIVVVDATGSKLSGVVNIQGFSTKLFWV